MYYKSANQRTKPDRQHQHSYSFCLLPLYFSSYRLQFKCPLRIRGISTLLTTCNNKVLLTAVCSRSKKKSTTAAAALRKKHLKDIRRFGSEFKWKLNQGVKSLWLCSRSQYCFEFGSILEWRVVKGDGVVRIDLVNIMLWSRRMVGDGQ